MIVTFVWLKEFWGLWVLGYRVLVVTMHSFKQGSGPGAISDGVASEEVGENDGSTKKWHHL
jgi:hypothetical protein